jgi:DNA-binding HxlR family transcriptional regulator
MRTYGQYCPVARASEVLAERWTPLIVRNLMFGATQFSDIARGVPTMSRSMLVKRLGDLERVGVIRSVPKPSNRGSTYHLTDAGLDLAATITALSEWGERWMEVTSEHSDPGFALWAWCQVQLDRDSLPEERVVVRFVFPDEPPTNRRYWMLVENNDAELCLRDPGGEPAVSVTAASIAFTDWHRGALSWASALRSGEIRIDGRRDLVRALPSWNLHRPAIPTG